MKTKRYLFVTMLYLFAFSCEPSARGQDALPDKIMGHDLTTEEVIRHQFGDFSRPADVLLAEAEAMVTEFALVERLDEYLEVNNRVTELRAAKGEELDVATDLDAFESEMATKIALFEKALKKTELEIRRLSTKLASDWLPHVQTSIDDQQGATLLQRANVLVSIRSKSGDVLEPTKLTLTAPGVSPVGFVQFRPGVYLAGDVPPGDYQLVWQLTPKSIVQRVSKITIGEAGCIACEVVLGLPKPKCTTKTVDAIVLPRLSPSGPMYGGSITESLPRNLPPLDNAPSYGPPTTNVALPNDAPPSTVAKPDVTASESDATRALIANEVEGPKIIAKEILLSVPILWDEECLFNDELIGLKFPTLSGERVVFFARQQSTRSTPEPLVLLAVAELHYQNGQLHGKVRRWSEEGMLLVEIPYRNGVIDGESQFFNRKGKLLGTSKLVQGNGTYRIWDRNKDEPVLMKEVEYVDGKDRPKP
ncbi:MAG: hypothetical protein JNL58_25365 [Planctomyces sp.]|nr:hypothetical protein [Planctomyces sp.]